MASTRFINDRGLTARMTLVLFLLGGLFVALVVALMFVFRNTSLWVFIGFAGIGVAWFQWYNSDTVALKAMRARDQFQPGAGSCFPFCNTLIFYHMNGNGNDKGNTVATLIFDPCLKLAFLERAIWENFT